MCIQYVFKQTHAVQSDDSTLSKAAPRSSSSSSSSNTTLDTMETAATLNREDSNILIQVTRLRYTPAQYTHNYACMNCVCAVLFTSDKCTDTFVILIVATADVVLLVA
jgi:hypothetical protein